MSQQIKEQVQIHYESIRNAEKKITELRGICRHENKFEGSYMYRVGSYMPALICSDCGKLIEYKNNVL